MQVPPCRRRLLRYPCQPHASLHACTSHLIAGHTPRGRPDGSVSTRPRASWTSCWTGMTGSQRRCCGRRCSTSCPVPTPTVSRCCVPGLIRCQTAGCRRHRALGSSSEPEHCVVQLQQSGTGIHGLKARSKLHVGHRLATAGPRKGVVTVDSRDGSHLQVCGVATCAPMRWAPTSTGSGRSPPWSAALRWGATSADVRLQHIAFRDAAALPASPLQCGPPGTGLQACRAPPLCTTQQQRDQLSSAALFRCTTS